MLVEFLEFVMGWLILSAMIFVTWGAVLVNQERKNAWRRGECDYYGNPIDEKE